MLSGTSSGVFKQFWRNYKTKQVLPVFSFSVFFSPDTFPVTNVLLLYIFMFIQARSLISFQFCGFDHGSATQNMAVHKSPVPPNYLAWFDLIDIPVHFVTGSEDVLICSDNVAHMYQTLCLHSPELASYACFEGKGHIDFTYGIDEHLANDIFAHCAQVRPP
jgi:hypothetical protein